MSAPRILGVFLLWSASGLASGQESAEWRDTHRIFLRNGNTVEGRLEKSSDPKFVALSYTHNIRVAIKAVDIVKIEVITIRASGRPVKQVDVPNRFRPESEDENSPPPAKDAGTRDLDPDLMRLVERPTPQGVELLVSRLEDLKEEHRNRVLEALRTMSSEEPIEPFLRKGLRSVHPDVRESTIRILSARRDVSSLHTFATLARDKAAVVRAAAAEALGNIGDESHLKVLAEASMDRELSVRAPAIVAARNIAGRVSAWEELGNLWLDRVRGGTDSARGDLAMALTSIVSKAGSDVADRTRQALAELITHRSREVRVRAIIGMAELKDDRSAETVRSLIDGESVPELQAEMCNTLSKIGLSSPAIIGTLIELLRSSNAPVRTEAERALKKLTGQFGFDSGYDTWAEWYNRKK